MKARGGGGIGDVEDLEVPIYQDMCWLGILKSTRTVCGLILNFNLANVTSLGRFQTIQEEYYNSIKRGNLDSVFMKIFKTSNCLAFCT